MKPGELKVNAVRSDVLSDRVIRKCIDSCCNGCTYFILFNELEYSTAGLYERCVKGVHSGGTSAVGYEYRKSDSEMMCIYWT